MKHRWTSGAKLRTVVGSGENPAIAVPSVADLLVLTPLSDNTRALSREPSPPVEAWWATHDPGTSRASETASENLHETWGSPSPSVEEDLATPVVVAEHLGSLKTLV